MPGQNTPHVAQNLVLTARPWRPHLAADDGCSGVGARGSACLSPCLSPKARLMPHESRQSPLPGRWPPGCSSVAVVIVAITAVICEAQWTVADAGRRLAPAPPREWCPRPSARQPLWGPARPLHLGRSVVLTAWCAGSVVVGTLFLLAGQPSPHI